jgi:3-hydroxybutyryl-CoA dehydrogenase
MRAEDIQHIAVIGVGFIGHQIAQEFAMAGYKVHMNDTSEKKLQTALTNIQHNLQSLVSEGVFNPDQVQPVMNRFITDTQLQSAVSNVDVVVEAVYEDISLKQEVFRKLDEACPEHTILASNSSTLMPSVMASAYRRIGTLCANL